MCTVYSLCSEVRCDKSQDCTKNNLYNTTYNTDCTSILQHTVCTLYSVQHHIVFHSLRSQQTQSWLHCCHSLVSSFTISSVICLSVFLQTTLTYSSFALPEWFFIDYFCLLGKILPRPSYLLSEDKIEKPVLRNNLKTVKPPKQSQWTNQTIGLNLESKSLTHPYVKPSQ